MSLQIHRAERADRLAFALAEVLSEPLDDPFATEIIAVPTRGVERWLAQQLSHRLGTSSGRGDGVCAGIAFPSPRRLVGTAVADALDTEPDDDPWQPESAVWPLLALIDASRGEPWARLLWSYLGDTTEHQPGDTTDHQPVPHSDTTEAPLDVVRSGRRWATARHLAELFARYASSRPSMINSWAQGHDVDGGGRPLSSEMAWQAELWRRLRSELGGRGPVQRLATAVERLSNDPHLTSLPSRLSVFGATRLDLAHQSVLGSLAEHRDVHLWLPQASPALWDAVNERLSARPVQLGPRTDDPTVALARHRLLGYLGRDSRELQQSLVASTTIAVDHHIPGSVDDAPIGSPATTLLAQLQSDLAANSPALPVDARPLFHPADRSVQIHAAHGLDRQVEVLREALVGMLADDPTLEPRDIVVMCPDIERFAPLISAAFGLDDSDTAAEHPGHRLRVRLADRSLRQLNPLLSVLSRLLDLADARMSASDLLDLCALPPVARRFGFTDDDLERLAQLVSRSGVRWGLDAEHRRPFGMAAFAQNTWAAGLDRLLLGVAMDEEGEHFIGTALPLDDVDSSDVDLVGRLAEVVDRVRVWCGAFTARHSLAEWIRLGRGAIEAMASVTPRDAWQIGHAHAELSRVVEPLGPRVGQSDTDEETVLLSLTEIRALLAEAFLGRASRANFRTGTLTMCTMHPMRSIPHRVVCLLGVDDGVFPRRTRPDGDDILAIQEWVGDRDPRSEDRQLLLDAIMAAEDSLLIIYAGADPRTGTERPPAVPIGELLDALDATQRALDDRPLRKHITIRHRLQPFDPGNFERGALVPGHRFSFDRAALRGARAAARPRQQPVSPYRVGLLPPAELPELITLTELSRFFQHPARALLRSRAGLTGTYDEPAAPDQLSVGLDGLEDWAIGDRLLRRHLQGSDLEHLAQAEWRRGTLPPRVFGERALTQVKERTRLLAETARPLLVGDPESRDVELPVADRVLTGTVGPLYGADLVSAAYSILSARQRLPAWLNLLALSAANTETAWRAVTIGRRGSSILGPVDGDWARLVLADLVELYRTGLREPIPFSPRASAAYAEVRSHGESFANHRDEIAEAWQRDRDSTWEQMIGPPARLEQLMSQPSVASEERGSLAEPSRFGTLARRVFHPMLTVEQAS